MQRTELMGKEELGGLERARLELLGGLDRARRRLRATVLPETRHIHLKGGWEL